MSFVDANEYVFFYFKDEFDLRITLLSIFPCGKANGTMEAL